VAYQFGWLRGSRKLLTENTFWLRGPIRTEYTILDHTVPQRTNPQICVSLTFAGELRCPRTERPESYSEGTWGKILAPIFSASLTGQWDTIETSLTFVFTIYNYMVVDSLSKTFSALSDPTRRAILDRLAHGPATVNAIAEPFRLSQQAISKHLAYLERSQIIEKTKAGRENICKLRPEAIKAVSDWALHYRRFFEESFHKLESVLEEMKRSEGKNVKTRK
jgi:DNA-binding transcriptional ArsR family regulator